MRNNRVIIIKMELFCFLSDHGSRNHSLFSKLDVIVIIYQSDILIIF